MSKNTDKSSFDKKIEEIKKSLSALYAKRHWAATCFMILFSITLISQVDRISLSGASPNLFWSALALLAVSAVALSPVVTSRLSGRRKKWVWAGSFVAFLVAAAASGNLQQAYDRTPEGAAAKQAMATADALAKKGREFEENNRIITERKQEYVAKLEDCFGTFNGDEMPKLTKAVKESLHNPESFEHIETKIALADVGATNVRMRFRGENGFSAIRTASVDAQVNPDDCSVIFVGKPEIEK